MKVDVFLVDQERWTETLERNGELAEVISPDDDDYPIILAEMEKAGRCSIGGGAMPLYRIFLAGRPYPFCSQPLVCCGKGYCQRDPCCAD